MAINLFNEVKRVCDIKLSKPTPIPQEEIEVFSLLKNKINTVFDVGPRTDLTYFNIKKNCSYHLFEPNCEFVKELKKQIFLSRDNRIILNEYGLSDRKENNCVYYKKSQSFIMNPVFHGKDVSGKSYSLRRLDDYVIENKILKIDFLKIDTEGLDYKVMMGGAKTIKNKVSYIQFEYWDGVKKFVDLLKNEFNLYLMMEPVLLKYILEQAKLKMTYKQKRINYRKSLIKLDRNIIDLIDNILVPMGCGGNIFGISKHLKEFKVQDLIFRVQLKV